MIINEISIILQANVKNLKLASGFSRLVCNFIKERKKGLINDQFVYSIELAVSEAVTNAIKFSRKRKFSLHFFVHEVKLIIFVKDYGDGFELESLREPKFDEFPESGYGLYILKSQMDQVRYIKNKKWNTLSMTKHFS